MIKYDGEAVYTESGTGIHGTGRKLFNDEQVSAIKIIVGEEIKTFKKNVVFIVKDMENDDYGQLETLQVFESVNDAEEYAFKHPRATIMPRKVITHGK